MPPADPKSSRRRWFAGLPALMIAFMLTGIYYTVPSMTSSMSMLGLFLYRSVVVFFGVVGLAQIAAAWSPSVGTLATPGFGRHRMVVPVEGMVYLTIMFALFTGAMLTKSNMLLLVFALMAGPFIMNGWMTFGMLQSARVVRHTPRRAMAGELFTVELVLSNSRPLLSIWVMQIKDNIRHAHDNLNATVLFARVGPRSSQTGHYQLRLLRRGRYKFGPTLTISRFPLGLVERSRLFKLSGEILIYPRVGRLGPSYRRRWATATELVNRPQAHAGIFHDEFHRLREFRIGDNPRDIHWRTSARRGELILREYQQNRDFNLAIILDLWQVDEASDAENALVEFALSFAATMIVEHGRHCRDATMTLWASGDVNIRWQGQGTSASLESLFDELAVINSGPGRGAVRQLEEAIQQLPISTQIVLLTTRYADDPDLPLETRNSRVDGISLRDIDRSTALIFDDEWKAHA